MNFERKVSNSSLLKYIFSDFNNLPKPELELDGDLLLH